MEEDDFLSAPPSEGAGTTNLPPPSEGGATTWVEVTRRPPELQGPNTAPIPPIHLHKPVLAGRLRLHRKNWEMITQDPWVLEAVSGLRLSFTHTPFQTRPPIMRVSSEEAQSISEEVLSLLEKGVVMQVPPSEEDQHFLSSLFTVPKKGGGRRPIINLKPLNTFIPHYHFKMEGIQSLRDIILRNDYVLKLDLKDAYFAVPIHKQDQKYLAFKWEGRMYRFTCLPFGLSNAPRVFTKIMRTVVAYLRAQGVRMVIYLDDMLFLSQKEEELLRWRSLVLDLLENLGFLVNYPKSSLTPSQKIEFLGFWLNTATLQLLLPKDKLSKTVKEAQNLLQADTASARQLAQLIGIFTSTLPAILPAPLHYRGLQELKHAILRKGGYNTSQSLTAEAREDLQWWAQNLPQMNGRALLRENPAMAIKTDASLTGWGAVCLEDAIGGPWTKEEKSLHINCLELLGATFAVQAFAKDKQNIVIQLHIDNATLVAYINHMGGTKSPQLMGGTKSPQLCALAKTLWDWCIQRGIFLVASHIAGVDNVEADFLSRSVVDRHDWQLNPAVFQKLNTLWGPLEVDLFASRITRQLDRFFSWRPDPLAEAVDAFRQSWTGLAGYANPPGA